MIEIILERSSMLATYISFYFMDFLIGKVFLSFKNIISDFWAYFF
jgi:hypothetical protein